MNLHSLKEFQLEPSPRKGPNQGCGMLSIIVWVRLQCCCGLKGIRLPRVLLSLTQCTKPWASGSFGNRKGSWIDMAEKCRRLAMMHLGRSACCNAHHPIRIDEMLSCSKDSQSFYMGLLCCTAAQLPAL